MIKGVSKRVIVVEPPDQKLFEQAIFLVRSDAAESGVSSRRLIEEARRVSRDCAGGRQTRRSFRSAFPWVLAGAALCGIPWLLTVLL